MTSPVSAQETKKRSVSPIQFLAIVMLLLTAKSSIAHLNNALGHWGYSTLEIAGAYLFSAFFGVAVGLRLEPKYWRGFEFGFVAVYAVSLVAKLGGLTEPALSIFVICACLSIMFVVQIGILDYRERRNGRQAIS